MKASTVCECWRGLRFPAARRAAVAAAAVLGLAHAAALAPVVRASRAAADAASRAPVRVSIRFEGRRHRIPQGFFGLSIEYNELTGYERSGPLFARIISLIRPRDGGSMTLRIGGKSADHALWAPDGQIVPSSPRRTRLPRGVFKIGPAWLSRLATFVRREDLRVILDLNLVVHSRRMAADFATAAHGALPARTLAGFEIGNEPDMYHYQPRLRRERVSSTSRSTSVRWWQNYSSGDYRRDYVSYARTLRARLGVPLGAPDIVSNEPGWLAAVAGLGRLNPTFLAIHRYASSTCWPVNSPGYPTVLRLLSEVQSAGLAGSVRTAIAFAHRRRMSLRLTEVNSISCGGNRGVADSFATALWAPDALFEMIEAGVDGVSWHVRPGTLNAPFRFSPKGIEPLPELYGLAIFAQMTHGPASVLRPAIAAPAAAHLKAWAVRRRGVVNLLLINKGGRAAAVRIPARRGGRPALIRRLTAPGPRATSGVRFAGMYVGEDGRWHAHEVLVRARPAGGFYHLLVPAYSAALVTL